ncbi:MAG: hypothetical protein HDS65_04505 [Bacteroidales bacterium]|nr:hypothetical protein [Bacteroidales bacterium]
MYRQKSKYIPYIIGAFAIALAYTVLYCLHPVLYDDWNYRQQMQSFIATPGLGTWWSDFCAGIASRYTLDNIRIANILYLLVCPLPQWIPSVIAGCTLYLTLMFGGRLAGCWGRNMATFAVFTVLYMFYEPWYEGMLLKSFAFNYSLASAVALGAALAIIRQRPSSYLLAIVSGLTAGLVHEAFTISLLGGVCMLPLFCPKYRSHTTLLWACGLLSALAVLYTAPGTALRSEGMATFANLYKLQLGLKFGSVFYLFFIAFILKTMLSRKHITPQLAFIFGASIGGWLIWRCFMGDYRPAWSMILFSSVGIACFVSEISRSRRRGFQIAGAILVLATIIQICSCIPWAACMHSEAAEANRIAADGVSGHFCSRTTAPEVPLYTFNRVNFDYFVSTGYPFSQVVPEELRNFAPEKAEKIADGLYRYQGLFIAEGIALGTNTVITTMYFDESPTDIYHSVAPFSTPAGDFYFLNPLGYFLYSRLYSSDSVKITAPTPY